MCLGVRICMLASWVSCKVDYMRVTIYSVFYVCGEQ